jgi:hypothetical protein
LSRVGVQSGRKLGIEQVDGGAHRSLRARLQPAASVLPRPAPRMARSSTALPSHARTILIGLCRSSNVGAAHRGNEYTVVLLVTPHVRFRTIRRASGVVAALVVALGGLAVRRLGVSTGLKAMDPPTNMRAVRSSPPSHGKHESSSRVCADRSVGDHVRSPLNYQLPRGAAGARRGQCVTVT